MELAPYVETLRRDLAAAAAPAGPDIIRAADLLGTALEASARMGLLEALSDAAAEITTKLNQASVEVRLRGREAQFVVTETTPADVTPPVTSPTPPSPDTEAGDITRMTLRLPEALKEAVERAAAAEGISVNAWLVRAVTVVVSGQPPWPPPPPPPPSGPPPPGGWGGRGRGGGRRLTGFAQA